MTLRLLSCLHRQVMAMDMVTSVTWRNSFTARRQVSSSCTVRVEPFTPIVGMTISVVVAVEESLKM